MMGRKLDLSGLTDEEAEHVLQVVQRDFSLRKKEEERLSEMKQKLDEEGNKCSILSKQQKFNEHCCIRCCSPFTFLINSKRQCQDCKYNICKSCSTYQKKEKAWICSVCQQARLLRTQSLDWYYNNVKSRFKCFGSAKVLKNLYKKHRLESGLCPDAIAEGSLYEGSFENEGSICGSDSTFYQQTEGHSMMDTLAVALRVAEEAVEEAISKAETYSDSLDKQNEACYLQEHKEDLIEELATTIVQKIIKKQKSKPEQAEADLEWPPSRSSGLASGAVSDQSMLTFPGSRRGSYTLWRSQSAFSLASEDMASKGQDPASSVTEAPRRQQKGQSRKQKEHKLSALPSWKSVDRLNETSDQALEQVAQKCCGIPFTEDIQEPGCNPVPCAGPPSIFQSTDGNWVALQNVTLPHPRMLAKPKSQVFKALENESSIVSAYDEMGSDSEDDYDWNVALNKLRRRPRQLPDDFHYSSSQYGTEWVYANNQYQAVTSPSSGLYTNTETLLSDSETSSVNSSQEAKGPSKPLWLQSRTQNDMPRMEKKHFHGELDVNFNPQATSLEYSDSSETEEVHYDLEKRSRRWKKNKAVSEDLCEEKNQAKANKMNLSQETPPGNYSLPALCQDFDDLSETDVSNEDQHHDVKPELGEDELKSRLFQLAAKMSDKETSSGEEQELEPGIDLENQKESLSSEENSKSIQEELKKEKQKAFDLHLKLQVLSTVLQQKYSAVSLCNISTEVLKVINATEELIAESTDSCDFPDDIQDKGRGTLPLGTDPVRLDEQLTTLEENVYLTASTVYGLEGQLTNLEDAARKISSVTEESELADLEDQVATAAAQVHHAELQISDIESRISALTVAGLNVAPCVRLTRKRDQKQTNQMHTIDTSRQQRRKLPAPPIQGEKIDGSPVTTVRTFNRNFMLQGSLTQRTKERKSTAKDLMEPAIGSAVMY
ncbi:rab effector MyRIP isoform X1 [Hirundo rustica]|uniref:rab effector MyRIP isoform X1 n=1 Tax=Hirundo rustica TaxID=43150 RepID=UPI002672500F|nr:rab effector MyRIP isoform X1 [Hirundo rustica]XP_058278438.1 rab effector MyRIP isoform X1 [Hirundo rustica]